MRCVPRHSRASSLVTTLLVLVVLSIILIAFFQSMTIEQKTARSYSHRIQAQLMAEAGVADAIQRLRETTKTGPWATIFLTDPSTPENSTPYLFYAKREDLTNQVATRRIPLFSTAFTDFVHFDEPIAPFLERANLDIADLDNAETSTTRRITHPTALLCNLNRSIRGYPLGTIGLNGTNSQPAAIPANWIYVQNADGKVVGRYAFWVDDESSKLDLRFAGGGSDYSRRDGADLHELSLHILTRSGLRMEQVENLLQVREIADFPAIPSAVRQSLNGGSRIQEAQQWQQIRPYLTLFSRHDDRSPNGRQKLNLNEAVTDTFDGDRIVQEVQAIRDAITGNLPRFGERYYSDASVPPEDQETYVTKIAANIRDFIDSDSVATVILPDGSAYTGNRGDFIPYDLDSSDPLPIWGKEQGPFLSEYLRVARVISPHFNSTAAVQPLTFRIAHYIELHNPTGKTITFHDFSNPFLLLSNRATWQQTGSGTPSHIRPADIQIFLPEDFSIEPNGYAVLTTDGPPFMDSQADYHGPENRYVIPKGTGPGTWQTVDAGGQTEPDADSSFEDFSLTTTTSKLDGNDRYNIKVSPSASSYADNRERLTFGDDHGLIDCALRIFTASNINLGRNAQNPMFASTFLGDGNSASENNTASGANTDPRFSRSDPRSNTEIPAIADNTSSVWKDGGKRYGALPAQATLGTTNFGFQQGTHEFSGVDLARRGWKEFTEDPAGNHFVANRPIQSVGELGFIYDPSRHSLANFRSHGATLRIGQSDDATNYRGTAANTNTPQEFRRWLGGRGSDSVVDPDYLKNAFLLTEVFRTDTNTSGRINPNSAIRDRTGHVFSATLDQFQFETNSAAMASTRLAGKPIATDHIISGVQNLATNGFLTAVGDISRSPIFHSGLLLAGENMAGTSDAGKEEFFRRTGNLLTTHSLAFTIFVRGQSGAFSGDTFIPTGNCMQKLTIQLIPEYPANPDSLSPSAPLRWHVVRMREIHF